MRIRDFAWAFAAVVFLGAGARAADAEEVATVAPEVVVTGTGLPRDEKSTGATVTVLTAGELDERQIERASEALRIVPGAFLSQGGPAGAPASLFLRGAGSNQTVVVVDGVQVNDPTIGGQFNFYDLGLANVERIEVLRGAASTFYGSDALGGVVNIVTRRGEGPLRHRLLLEGGSFGHVRGSLSAGADFGAFDFSAALTRDRWRNELPNQEYHATTFAGSVGFEPAEGTRIELRGRAFESMARDPWDFPFGAQIERDPNIRRDRRTGLAALTVRQDVGERVTVTLTGSIFDVESHLRNGPDSPGAPDELVSDSDAQVRTGRLSATVRLPEPGEWLASRVVLGGEYEDEISVNSSRSSFGAGPAIDRTVRDRAAFVLAETDWFDRVTLSGGLRRTRNSFFGWRTTASASALVRVDETGSIVRANYGEGFRAPTPVEFDDPYVGNADLGPEKSVSVDFGVEQSLLDGDVAFAATWFRLRGRDFIVYDPDTYRLENRAGIDVRGVEIDATVRPHPNVSVRGWLTVQDADDLPGRPERFGGADVTWRIDPVTLGLSVVASDDSPSTGKITPEGRHRDHPGRKLLLGLRAEWWPTDGLRLFARVENLLDDRYYDDEAAPDGRGRGFYAGFQLDF